MRFNTYFESITCCKMTMEYPTHVSKSFMNPLSRRTKGKGKQTWRVYGYDRYGHFKTERITGTLLGLKPRMKLYFKKTGNCTECGKHGGIIVEKKSHPMICIACQLNRE